MAITEPTATSLIRALPSDNEKWRFWLDLFPELPTGALWQIDRWIVKFDPHLAIMPAPSLLPNETRWTLRALLAEFAGELRDVQRRADAREKIEGGLLAGSGMAWKLGLTWLEPYSLSASAALFVRNRVEDFRWKQRKRDLKALAIHITKLGRSV